MSVVHSNISRNMKEIYKTPLSAVGAKSEVMIPNIVAWMLNAWFVFTLSSSVLWRMIPQSLYVQMAVAIISLTFGIALRANKSSRLVPSIWTATFFVARNSQCKISNTSHFSVNDRLLKVKHLGIKRWPSQWPTCVPTHWRNSRQTFLIFLF